MDTSKFSNNENIELDINTLKNAVNFDEFVKTLQKNLIPTDEFEGFKIRPGFYLENGAVVIPGGVNFTIHSQNATSCKLLLFKPAMCEPYAVIPFPEYYRIGNVYSMIVLGLDIEEFEYAYNVDGPYIPERGLVFDSSKFLLDPYSKAIAGQSVWGTKTICGNQYKSRVVSNDFDWGNSKRPLIPMKDLIIYELHVRGFTKHPSSKVNYPGTFAGLAEKIPYLKELGINAVELMPIFEFDEMLDARYVRGNLLCDYWGYNPVCFFAPNTSYTAGIERNKEGDELKSLIKKFHEDGIEVILDVVFNHTAEGNEYGPYISFKGFDNNVYCMLTPDGKYYNFSGCGNTLNCNHPIVHRMILDCLRYWVTEYRVDGFRFDLASILGRNEDGSPMNNPPLLQSLAFDPILANTKLIAEAWDAGGLYQVGSFPSWKRWCEWNGNIEMIFADF
ncbi:glycogen debranching enzyme GlgX [Clostridium beijerinckii]|nr:glycogen debranching enzyme GlgX [Clostridium beijerinckii]